MHHNFTLRVCTDYSTVGHSPLFLYYELLILVITQALVLCLIYIHSPSGVMRIYQAKHSRLCYNYNIHTYVYIYNACIDTHVMYYICITCTVYFYSLYRNLITYSFATVCGTLSSDYSKWGLPYVIIHSIMQLKL